MNQRQKPCISMAAGDAGCRAEMHDILPEGRGRNLREYGMGASNVTVMREYFRLEKKQMMEAVVERENMERALYRVMANKGAPGVDGMTVDDLRGYVMVQWPRIKEELLEGRYKPQPVRKVEIPKPGGKGMRQLGIPTVIDRLIQQALHQVLQPVFDPGFSESSYGFRPRRSAHDAVCRARLYVEAGRQWVVDMDLEKFFDRVNHDVLMSRVARKVKDKRMLKLIRRYLQAGILIDGVVSQRTEGTPQGGPLSPLLSNILLDDLDKELEKRGHWFCRYADDCNIYVKSRRAGERVLSSITRFLERRLKLKVNQDKSAVDRPQKRKFLGYSMTFNRKPRLRVAPNSVKRLKDALREQFRQGRGRNLKRFIETLTPKLQGWVNYFRLAECKGIFAVLDEWIRHKLRCILWRQWKRPYTRAMNLMKRGIDEKRAWISATNQRGPWWNSGASHMNQAFPISFFDELGLVSLQNHLHRLQCGS